jgi:predicted RNase H-like nuclease (RuvC/YqgF family)
MRFAMDQSIGELVNECVQLQDEIGLLTPIILSLSPSLNMGKMAVNEISKASRRKFKEKFERLLGLEKVKAEYARHIRQLDLKLSDLAERLEEEDFEIEKLRSQLSEDQFSWLLFHKKDLKKHLKGIAI